MPAATWLFGLTVLGFVGIAAALAAGAAPLAALDHRVLEWGYRATEGSAVRTAWWLAVARYGAPLVLRAIVLVLAAVQAAKRRWQITAWLVGVAVVENLAAPGAKLLLNRPRPHWLHPIAVEHSLSFPSGHAAGAGMFVTVIVLLVQMTVSSKPLRYGVIALVTAVALTICADRIFLGVHYLSDVAGGVLLGMATVTAGWLLLLGFRARRARLAEPGSSRAGVE
jgi:undecaprenyl-diphosphatase